MKHAIDIHPDMIINDPLPELTWPGMKPNDPEWLKPSPLDNQDDAVDKLIVAGVDMDADAITIEIAVKSQKDRTAATHWKDGNPIATQTLNDGDAKEMLSLIGNRMRSQPGIECLRIMHEDRVISVSWHDGLAVLGIGFSHKEAIDAAKLRCDGRLSFGRPTQEQVAMHEHRRLSSIKIYGLTPIPFKAADPVVKNPQIAPWRRLLGFCG